MAEDRTRIAIDSRVKVLLLTRDGAPCGQLHEMLGIQWFDCDLSIAEDDMGAITYLEDAQKSGNPPDVILACINLSAPDHVLLKTYLESTPALRNLPVFALSAQDYDPDLVRKAACTDLELIYCEQARCPHYLAAQRGKLAGFSDGVESQKPESDKFRPEPLSQFRHMNERVVEYWFSGMVEEDEGA